MSRCRAQGSAATKKIELRKAFPSPTCCTLVLSADQTNQKPVFGSQGGTVYGSEAYAPTFGARTQSLTLAAAWRAATLLPAAMAWVVKAAAAISSPKKDTIKVCRRRHFMKSNTYYAFDLIPDSATPPVVEHAESLRSGVWTFCRLV